MNILKINDLSTAQAEDLISILWRVLEERRISSPQLNVTSGSSGIDLSVSFGSEADADLAMRALPHFALAVDPE